MQVIVKARHTRVPAAMKQMATEKIERVRRFFDRIGTLEIEFSEEHNPRVTKKHIVEVNLTTKNHVLRAVGAGVDPASAVDVAVDKLESQVLRMKDKMVKRSRTGNGSVKGRVASNGGTSRNGKANLVESRQNTRTAPRVRRTGRFSVEPMTPKEAAIAIDMTGEQFLPFVNAETDQVSVVYRRDDGSFGLLEPAE